MSNIPYTVYEREKEEGLMFKFQITTLPYTLESIIQLNVPRNQYPKRSHTMRNYKGDWRLKGRRQKISSEFRRKQKIIFHKENSKKDTVLGDRK